MKTTIGGDRLGSGNKQNVQLKTYNRSTHDLSYIWRSSMASGTLVPFMSEVGLPGDSFDIDLQCEVLTLPTIGPLFGSYKVQLDVFSVPIRLYNGLLHMNKLGIGMQMNQVKLPQIEVGANWYLPTNTFEWKNDDNSQINSSSILSYLNIRGLGRGEINEGNAVQIKRQFNAVPFLAYWDIYKNYYANKQEERGFVIHKTLQQIPINTVNGVYIQIDEGVSQNIYDNPTMLTLEVDETKIFIEFDLADIPDVNQIYIMRGVTPIKVVDNWETWIWDADNRQWRGTNYSGDIGAWEYEMTIEQGEVPGEPTDEKEVNLVEFPLENIDTMRETILKNTQNGAVPVTIDESTDAPYGLALDSWDNEDGSFDYSILYTQEGLGIKTYQSDLFNNWISTEWIDGANGINEVTAVSTSGDSFTIDALNLASKVYNMLNRIAISGGSYDDWLDATYTHERSRNVENPVYMGSLIKELTFEEVISNAESEEMPLGTLAGRGRLTNKNKGGRIKVKIDEPSYIIGIVSLTPRVDFSQGNKFDVNLKTLDDLHKPALDEIGYQDLITDQMAWFDTMIDESGDITYKSAGKQPAWINYMTNVNQVRGHFAEKDNSMFMTLNRRYELDETNGIGDLTTYIDPTKYNHIFAETSIDAQNFWVQIGLDITARRKMSAKVIPNL